MSVFKFSLGGVISGGSRGLSHSLGNSGFTGTLVPRGLLTVWSTHAWL